MVNSPASEWYEHQRSKDRRSRELSESYLGPEAQIFVQAMNLTAQCLDAVFTEPKDDLTFRRKISVAHYGFNLLYSAWDEALAGRYQTATNHFRSISEVPDFLAALDVDPKLADEMGERNRVKVERARRAVKAALKRGDPAKAIQWEHALTERSKGLQGFSHISLESLGQSLPVIVRDGATQAVLCAGGAVSPFTLRLVAIRIAVSTLDMLLHVTHAFFRDTGLEQAEWLGLATWSGQSADTLSKEIAAIAETRPEPVSVLYLATTREVVR